MKRKFISGNLAVALAAKMARVGVVAAYPITPQTTISEKLASYVSNGELQAEYIRVESEHSAMAACMGASVVGTRPFTATSSHGLCFMHEMLNFVAGGRFPIVMAVVNRSVAPPWSIWGEHQDAIMQRDTGWIQLYVETAQEAFDTVLMAFRIAEHPKVMTPVMVCLDGFQLSHTEELVFIPEQKEVDGFVALYSTPAFANIDKPLTLAMGGSGKVYTAWRYEQQTSIQAAADIIQEIDGEFSQQFGRSYGGVVDPYRYEDAEVMVVTMGATAGTVREAVDTLRTDGVKAGLLRIKAYRPFVAPAVRKFLAEASSLVVIDRDLSYGYEGALSIDIKAALYGLSRVPLITNWIAGLGGADITPQGICDMVKETISQQESRFVFQFEKEF